MTLEQIPLFSKKHRLTPAQKSLLRRVGNSSTVVLYDLATASRRTAVCLAREGFVVLRIWQAQESQEPSAIDFASFSREKPTGRWGLKPADALLVAVAWKVEVQLA